MSPRAAAATSMTPGIGQSPTRIISSATPERRAARCWSAAAAAARSDRLRVDAAQQAPIAEQVARPHLAHLQPAGIEEGAEWKVSVETNLAGERRQALLDEAHRRILAGEMIDHDNGAAGPAYPPHLRCEPRRVRHH